MTAFSRYIGIDYSGAQTPTASLKGLRVYVARGADMAVEEPPFPPSPRKYWTRRGLAEWLVLTLRESPPTLVGIDHGFSFPSAYFQKHKISGGWSGFLDDFCAHWPTGEDHMYVEFVRDGMYGSGAARQGKANWRRLPEQRVGAKSVFHFDVQGAVAKSTHAGLPWLRFLRQSLGQAVHFWPFDGWVPRSGVHVVAEVYPALWRGCYPVEGRTPDQQDAYSASRWLQEADREGKLKQFFDPPLAADERVTAEVEGWILGVR